MTDEGPGNLSRPVTPTSMGQSATRDYTKSQEDISVERLNLILGWKMARNEISYLAVHREIFFMFYAAPLYT